MPTSGVKRVINNYRDTVKDISQRRTYEAVDAVLRTGMNMAATMVPRDTSALFDSAYDPQIAQHDGHTVGHVGYTAEYALWVHEMPGTLKGQPRADFGRTANHSDAGPLDAKAFGGGTGRGDYWDPNAEPKFLEKGFEQTKASAPAILKAKYRV